MPRVRSAHPTELELEILKVLWREGPCGVRRTREALAASAGRKLAHTSVITVMNIMTEKGYLKRTRGQAGFVYAARAARGTTLGRMLRDLVDRAFGGSGAAAMVNLIEDGNVSEAELKELRELIDRKSKEQRK